MLTLSPQLRIANAAAVLTGPHGDVTRRARQHGLSRQALYRDTRRVLHTLQGHDTAAQLQQLREQVQSLRDQLRHLQTQCQDAVLVNADRLAVFASTAQAEGV